MLALDAVPMMLLVVCWTVVVNLVLLWVCRTVGQFLVIGCDLTTSYRSLSGPFRAPRANSGPWALECPKVSRVSKSEGTPRTVFGHSRAQGLKGAGDTPQDNPSNNPFFGDTLSDTPRDTSGSKGPKDSCSWSVRSQAMVTATCLWLSREARKAHLALNLRRLQTSHPIVSDLCCTSPVSLHASSYATWEGVLRAQSSNVRWLGTFICFGLGYCNFNVIGMRWLGAMQQCALLLQGCLCLLSRLRFWESLAISTSFCDP